jgi:hypothetical protein
MNDRAGASRRLRLRRWLLLLPVGLVTTPAVLWSAAALWFDGPASRLAAGLLALAWLLAVAAAWVWVRPRRRALAVCWCGVAIVAAWWFSLAPSNDRDWYPDVARTAWAQWDGSKVTIHHVRDFHYRSTTDYDERWVTRSYDLSQLQGVDLFISYWGPRAVAHTISSWEFSDGQHLAISIETRKEKGESYSALRGFFRQYELYYVVATEQDVIRLRTNCRGEEVYRYRVRMSAERAGRLLQDYLSVINRLNQHPRWYNALTQNCTTTIRYHAKQVGVVRPWDWRLLFNGYLDELMYQRGSIDTSVPFAQLRAGGAISEKARQADASREFSAVIRDPAR